MVRYKPSKALLKAFADYKASKDSEIFGKKTKEMASHLQMGVVLPSPKVEKMLKEIDDFKVMVAEDLKKKKRKLEKLPESSVNANFDKALKDDFVGKIICVVDKNSTDKKTYSKCYTILNKVNRRCGTWVDFIGSSLFVQVGKDNSKLSRTVFTYDIAGWRNSYSIDFKELIKPVNKRTVYVVSKEEFREITKDAIKFFKEKLHV